MKTAGQLLFVMLVVLAVPVAAQVGVDSPECVVFDSVSNRYLVSSRGTGSIIAIDSLGDTSYWQTGLGHCLGNTIRGNTFYVSTGTAVRGFDLTTGEQVMTKVISGSHQLDGMTTDNDGNLYVVDYDFSASANDGIFKIRLSDETVSSFVYSGLPAGQVFSASDTIYTDGQTGASNQAVLGHIGPVNGGGSGHC